MSAEPLTELDQADEIIRELLAALKAERRENVQLRALNALLSENQPSEAVANEKQIQMYEIYLKENHDKKNSQHHQRRIRHTRKTALSARDSRLDTTQR